MTRLESDQTSYAPTWPYELWWCDACGEPCVTSTTHDPDEHPGGCGGEVTTYVVGPIAPLALDERQAGA